MERHSRNIFAANEASESLGARQTVHFHSLRSVCRNAQRLGGFLAALK
jgi:hypothetical protein